MTVLHASGTESKLAAIRKSRKAKKKVVYKTSDLTSPSVIRVLQYLIAEGLVTADEIEEKYTTYHTKWSKLATTSPILYGDAFNNVGEAFAFQLLRTAWTSDEPVKGAPKFGSVHLSRLFDYVRAENKNFFPLRDLYTRTVFTGTPNLVSVPSKVYPEYSGVTTAAIFSNVDVALNHKFMQRLIDFAYLTGIEGPSAKYKTQGGKISDSYCFIETVLVHELRHFSYGDLSLNQVLTANPEVVNFAQDFRINHNLLKADLPQLPMGCFSSRLNYDTHATLDDIIRVVEEELKKFEKENKPEDQNKNQETSDQTAGDDKLDTLNSDEHYTNDGTYRPRADEPGKTIPGMLDKSQKKILRRVNKDQIEQIEKIVTQSSDVDYDGDVSEMLPGNNVGGPGSGATVQPRKVDGNVEPKYDWKTILRRAVKSADDLVEESYAKPSRRAISRVAAAIETGVAAVKPGEIKTDMSRFVLISDTSYSMIDVTKRVTAEFMKLLKQSDFGDAFYLFQFSDTFDAYQCSVRKKIAYRLLNESLKKVGAPVSLNSAFAGRFQGTTITKLMADHLISLASQGYNIILATDSDVLYGSNKIQLDRVMKFARRKFYIIFDSKETYSGYVKSHPMVSRNITYWK